MDEAQHFGHSNHIFCQDLDVKKSRAMVTILDAARRDILHQSLVASTVEARASYRAWWNMVHAKFLAAKTDLRRARRNCDARLAFSMADGRHLGKRAFVIKAAADMSILACTHLHTFTPDHGICIGAHLRDLVGAGAGACDDVGSVPLPPPDSCSSAEFGGSSSSSSPPLAGEEVRGASVEQALGAVADFWRNIYGKGEEGRDQGFLEGFFEGDLPVGVPVSLPEVLTAIFTLKAKKASGEDQVAAEMIVEAAEQAGPPIVSWMNDFITAGVADAAEVEHVVRVSLIPKVSCPAGPGDFRPIAVLNVLQKLWEMFYFVAFNQQSKAQCPGNISDSGRGARRASWCTPLP